MTYPKNINFVQTYSDEEFRIADIARVITELDEETFWRDYNKHRNSEIIPILSVKFDHLIKERNELELALMDRDTLEIETAERLLQVAKDADINTANEIEEIVTTMVYKENVLKIKIQAGIPLTKAEKEIVLSKLD